MAVCAPEFVVEIGKLENIRTLARTSIIFESVVL